MCSVMCAFADEGSESSAALDDSVSEEDGSFDELSDGTPYLQSGVELPMLNEVSQLAGINTMIPTACLPHNN